MAPTSPSTPASPATSDAPTNAERPTRRSFVFLGALAATALLPKAGKAQGKTRKRPVAEPVDSEFPTVRQNESVAAFSEWETTLGRLVRRASYGATAAEVAKANQLGFQGYINYQLNYTRIDDSAVDTAVAQRWPLLSQTSDALFSADSNTVRAQLQESTIYRAAFSQRQLYERMVEFWSDHFNQDYDKVGYLLVADQRDVIRKHALGKFPNLLKASAHSASMMVYLDQTASTNKAPNQNYAREIMELHTLGVDGGYTQDDVAELSRVLTGWRVQGRGQFFFDPTKHDIGAKTVMGVTIPASPSQTVDGINEGEKMLDFLVNHPNTMRFIATKMLKWLLTPNPTETQIAAIASVYKATGGDIKAMVRAILNDAWLAAAPMKLKRPFHFLASSLRSTAPTIVSMATFNSQLNNNLGQSLFAWDTPDGYPDKIEYWAGNIVPRWNYATVVSALNSQTTAAVDTTAYRAGSPDAAVDLIDQNFFGGEMPLVTRNALLAYVKAGTFNDTRVREAIGLAISANAFQWY